jgi:hypothetical protein
MRMGGQGGEKLFIYSFFFLFYGMLFFFFEKIVSGF